MVFISSMREEYQKLKVDFVEEREKWRATREDLD
jgi:hypothetical protein